MTAHLHPELAQIKTLAEADAAVDRLDKAITTVDAELAATERRVTEAIAAREAARAAAEANKVATRTRERELDTYADRRKGALRVLETGVGDAAAAERQLAQVAAIVDRLETEQLEAMERQDALDAALVAATKAVTAAEAALTTARADLPPVRAARVAERATAAEGRAAAEAALPIDVRTRYANVRKRSRVAVAEVRDGTCTACNLTVPMQQLADLRAGRSMEACRGCGRWIWVKG